MGQPTTPYLRLQLYSSPTIKLRPQARAVLRGERTYRAIELRESVGIGRLKRQRAGNQTTLALSLSRWNSRTSTLAGLLYTPQFLTSPLSLPLFHDSARMTGYIVALPLIRINMETRDCTRETWATLAPSRCTNQNATLMNTMIVFLSLSLHPTPLVV